MIDNDRLRRAEKSLRRKLQKILRECELNINTIEYLRERRPDCASFLTPDACIYQYAMRQWAKRALACLDAGEPIPDAPSPDDLDSGESRDEPPQHEAEELTP